MLKTTFKAFPKNIYYIIINLFNFHITKTPVLLQFIFYNSSFNKRNYILLFWLCINFIRSKSRVFNIKISLRLRKDKRRLNRLLKRAGPLLKSTKGVLKYFLVRKPIGVRLKKKNNSKKKKRIIKKNKKNRRRKLRIIQNGVTRLNKIIKAFFYQERLFLFRFRNLSTSMIQMHLARLKLYKTCVRGTKRNLGSKERLLNPLVLKHLRSIGLGGGFKIHFVFSSRNSFFHIWNQSNGATILRLTTGMLGRNFKRSQNRIKFFRRFLQFFTFFFKFHKRHIRRQLLDFSNYQQKKFKYIKYKDPFKYKKRWRKRYRRRVLKRQKNTIIMFKKIKSKKLKAIKQMKLKNKKKLSYFFAIESLKKLFNIFKISKRPKMFVEQIDNTVFFSFLKKKFSYIKRKKTIKLQKKIVFKEVANTIVYFNFLFSRVLYLYTCAKDRFSLKKIYFQLINNLKYLFLNKKTIFIKNAIRILIRFMAVIIQYYLKSEGLKKNIYINETLRTLNRNKINKILKNKKKLTSNELNIVEKICIEQTALKNKDVGNFIEAKNLFLLRSSLLSRLNTILFFKTFRMNVFKDLNIILNHSLTYNIFFAKKKKKIDFIVVKKIKVKKIRRKKYKKVRKRFRFKKKAFQLSLTPMFFILKHFCYYDLVLKKPECKNFTINTRFSYLIKAVNKINYNILRKKVMKINPRLKIFRGTPRLKVLLKNYKFKYRSFFHDFTYSYLNIYSKVSLENWNLYCILRFRRFKKNLKRQIRVFYDIDKMLRNKLEKEFTLMLRVTNWLEIEFIKKIKEKMDELRYPVSFQHACKRYEIKTTTETLKKFDKNPYDVLAFVPSPAMRKIYRQLFVEKIDDLNTDILFESYIIEKKLKLFETRQRVKFKIEKKMFGIFFYDYFKKYLNFRNYKECCMFRSYLSKIQNYNLNRPRLVDWARRRKKHL